MSILDALLAILVVGAVTLMIRALPFIFFRRRKTPSVVLYLGQVLPIAIMAILVIYCLKDITPTAYPFGLPEIIAAGIVVGLHVWKHNTLISIFSGTVAYMLMVQLVFV